MWLPLGPILQGDRENPSALVSLAAKMELVPGVHATFVGSRIPALLPSTTPVSRLSSTRKKIRNGKLFQRQSRFLSSCQPIEVYISITTPANNVKTGF